MLCAALGGGVDVYAGRSCKLEMLCCKGKKKQKNIWSDNRAPPGVKVERVVGVSRDALIPAEELRLTSQLPRRQTPARSVSRRDDATCNLMHKHNIKVQAEGTAVIQQELKCKVFLASLFLLRPVMYNSAQLCWSEIKLWCLLQEHDACKAQQGNSWLIFSEASPPRRVFPKSSDWIKRGNH